MVGESQRALTDFLTGFMTARRFTVSRGDG